MSQTSPRLKMPFLQPSQAQKHVTHNEALRQLDTIVQLSFDAMDATTPPPSPADGDTYAIGAAATGDWSGHDGEVATWFDAAWDFHLPQAGWIATLAGSPDLYVHDGAGWIAASASVNMNNLTGVGVNATADGTNRLAVSAQATLLNHEGNGHQLKINKAASGDTASLLFQSNWSGRAEMGLAGSDAFSIKVSADGSSWTNALSLSAGDGVVTTANMVGTVAATPGAGDAVIETGTGANGSYTKFADGTLMCQINGFATSSGAAATWTLPASFASTAYAITATVIGGTPHVITIASQGTGSADVESFNLSGADTVSPSVNLIAIGRWV